MDQSDGDDEAASLPDVCQALSDPDCRTIIEALEEPKTAADLAEECDIPQSTTYRKLDTLTEAGLLREETSVRQDGYHTTTYRIGFRNVHVFIDNDGRLDADIQRTEAPADQRLEEMWKEIQKET